MTNKIKFFRHFDISSRKAGNSIIFQKENKKQKCRKKIALLCHNSQRLIYSIIYYK